MKGSGNTAERTARAILGRFWAYSREGRQGVAWRILGTKKRGPSRAIR